jgi:surface antigen
MINRPFIYSALAAVIAFSGNTIAEDQQPVYDGPLITQQESLDHFEKMNNAKTASERQKIQQEHHQLMQKRAEARGEKLREMPKGEEGQQPGYGGPLISQQESLEHHEKMKNAKTASERQKIQQEHNQLMQKRSEARRLEHREMSKKQYESGAGGNETGAGMGTGSSGGK